MSEMTFEQVMRTPARCAAIGGAKVARLHRLIPAGALEAWQGICEAFMGPKHYLGSSREGDVQRDIQIYRSRFDLMPLGIKQPRRTSKLDRYRFVQPAVRQFILPEPAVLNLFFAWPAVCGTHARYNGSASELRSSFLGQFRVSGNEV